MRLSFRKQSAPRWVDSAGFDWVPDSPLYDGREPGNDLSWKEDAGWKEDWQAEDRIERPAAAPSTAPRLAPLPAREETEAPALFLPRLAIGLGQAVALYLLWHARAAGAWPGSDPALFSACWLGGLVAPLLLLEGLGTIEIRRLLLWSGAIGFVLATLGLWLTALPHPALMLAVAIIAIILAQGWFHAAQRDGTPVPAAANFWDFAWAVGVRLCACVLIWAVLVLPGLGKDWPRWGELAFPLLPLLGPIAAALFAVTAASGRVLLKGIQICLWVGLPLLLLGTLPLAGVYLLRWFFLQGH